MRKTILWSIICKFIRLKYKLIGYKVSIVVHAIFNYIFCWSVINKKLQVLKLDCPIYLTK